MKKKCTYISVQASVRAPVQCLSGLTGEIESHRRRVRCRFPHLFIIHSFTPSKRKMCICEVLFPGTHSTAYSTRERIETKREKKENEKEKKKKISIVHKKKARERESGRE